MEYYYQKITFELWNWGCYKETWCIYASSRFRTR